MTWLRDIILHSKKDKSLTIGSEQYKQERSSTQPNYITDLNNKKQFSLTEYPSTNHQKIVKMVPQAGFEPATSRCLSAYWDSHTNKCNSTAEHSSQSELLRAKFGYCWF